jgi:hypothetical protein
MSEPSKADLRTAEIKERFKVEAQEFFDTTHGIIDASNGKDAITHLAAESFVPYSLMALKEDGFEPTVNSDPEGLSDKAFYAFSSTIKNEDDHKYVIQNQDHYKLSLNIAITEEMHRRKIEIDKRENPNIMSRLEYVIL